MIKNSIVLVPFPFDDFSSTKVRPAICLSSGIGKYNLVIVAFISSNIRNKPEENDILITKGSDFHKGTNLQFDSIIKLHRIVTIPRKLFKRKIGTANELLTEEINAKLKKIFELK